MDFEQVEVEVIKDLEDDELKKNSSVHVTVDDLYEGMIVVSYVHQDNLYQGVLLQLNRERGIPSGISFPKDICTGSAWPVDEGENDLSQTMPLNQRHTYFQDKDSATLEANSRVKSRVGLRRIIKPPARFKNSRMSLRLRGRPILCAKCKTLCEEKPVENNTEQEKSKNKNSLKKSGASTRKGMPKEKQSNGVPIISIVTPDASTDTITSVHCDHDDYSYESFGTNDVVENYWRRPLSKQNGKVKQRNHIPLNSLIKPLGEYKSGIETSVPIIVPIQPVSYSNSTDSTSEHGSIEKLHLLEVIEPLIGSTLVTKPTSRKRRKSESLKSCINKLAMSQSSSFNTIHFPTSCSDNPDTEDPLSSLADCPEIRYEQLPGEPLSEECLSNTLIGPVRMFKKVENLTESRKRSSTVPVRFRDETYLTRKNIFNFKRRRGDETDELEGTTEITLRDSEFPLENVPSVQDICEKQEGSTSELSRSSSCSSMSFSHTFTQSNGHVSVSDIKKEPVTSAKIPVLKISFGFPGNGIVVVPPKEYPSDVAISESDSKAARRALRKAKKEARRKIPPVTLDHSLASLPPLVLNYVYPLPCQNSSHNNIELMYPLDDDEPSAPYETLTPPKRKKKDKKRKRSRPSKHELPSLKNETVEQDRNNILPNVASTLLEENHVPLWNDVAVDVIPDMTVHEEEMIKNSQNLPAKFEEFPRQEETIRTSGKHRDTQSHHRLFISLKRTESSDPNSYISCRNANSDAELSNSSDSITNVTQQEAQERSSSRDSFQSESHDYPVNVSPVSHSEADLTDSINIYTDDGGTTYRRNDIIWGKLPGCPWWPGKILDIFFTHSNDVRAKVAWYQATTESLIRFSQVVPFESQFDLKYKTQKRGSYKKAVRAALVEVHQLNPDDLTSD